MDDRAALTGFARLQRKAERRVRVEFRLRLHDGAPALKEHARDARREALPRLDNAQVLGSYAHLRRADHLARARAKLPLPAEHRNGGVAVGVRRRHVAARDGARADETTDDAVA